MDNTILRLESVNKTYVKKNKGQKQIVRAARDISLSLKRQQILALVGESGSGKSTLAKLITRVEKPDKGTILFDGKPLRDWDKEGPREYHRRVQMVFQDPFAALNPLKTIGYAVSRPLRNYHHCSRREVPERVQQILQTVQLTPTKEFESKLPFELSGGQLQRVVIARALASNPDLIVADEPVSMLDVSIRADVLRLLSELRNSQGVSLLYITHDLISARMIADEIVVLYRGTVVERGPANELALNPKHPYTQLLLQSIPNPWTDTEDEIAASVLTGAHTPSKQGCVFCDRCMHVMDRCMSVSPALDTVESGRSVACFLYTDKSLPVEPE